MFYNYQFLGGLMSVSNISSLHCGFFDSLYRSTSSLIYSLCYKILSISHQCLGKKNEQRNSALLSDYYFERASAVEAYFLFGSDLLTPIVNMEKTNCLTRPLNHQKIEDCFRNASGRKPPSVTLDRSRFPQDKITDGICVAFVLKFISKYLQAIRNGQDIQNVIRTLGKKFEEGGSEGIAIVHGIQSTISAPSELEFYQTLASLYEVGLSGSSLSFKFTSWENAEGSLTPHLENLQDGIYFSSEINKDPKEQGHLIAYIKDQNNRFIFDPQLGTVQIPQNKDAEYLIKSLKYASGDQITFFKASLQN
jgi:hypothetical protein